MSWRNYRGEGAKISSRTIQHCRENGNYSLSRVFAFWNILVYSRSRIFSPLKRGAKIFPREKQEIFHGIQHPVEKHECIIHV